MPGGWAGSERANTLPPNWDELRAGCIRNAGGRCQATLRDGTRCKAKATDADHITPHHLGGTDHPSNLQALCPWHHSRKSSREGNAARNAKRKARPAPKHPGLL